jgi:rubrerythrin
MQAFDSVDAVLDFAIEREEEAFGFYMDLAGKVDRAHMKELFEQFAREEKGHKAKLQRVKQGKLLLSVQNQVLDLKMSDYLVTDETAEQISYQEALILAMKKEKVAFKLYTDLEAAVSSADLKNTFLSLAQEEAKHKLRFEVEYDNEIMGEN